MMARANFVAKAMKDNPAALKGESYWWWKFRYGPKRYSKTRPERHQLTQSGFYSQLWQLEDHLPMALDAAKDLQGVEAEIENLIADLEMLMEECQESLDNMPESLQESSASGELLSERIEGIEGWISELQSIDLEMAEEEPDDDEVEDHLENIKEEVINTNPGIG